MCQPLTSVRLGPRISEHGGIMAAYMVAQVLSVTDPVGFREYGARVTATVERYGGRFLVRRGDIQALEGDWGARMVIIEFESVARAREWYESEEYRPLIELRQRTADTMLSIVEGVPGARGG